MPTSEQTRLYRSGMISGKQWAKLGASTGGGSLKQKSKMAKFEDRGGVRDQGGNRDKGDSGVASSRSINTHTGKMWQGGPTRAGSIKQPREVSTPGPVTGGRDSGGAVNAYGQPATRGGIDAPARQTPAFPVGSRKGPDASNPPSPKGKPNRKFKVGNAKRAKGPSLSGQPSSGIPKRGGQYGGGGKDTQ